MPRRKATFEVLPNQANYIECQCLFSAGYGGVGSGKTYAAQWKIFKRLRRYPRAGHYVCGADFEQLRSGYFLDFRNLLEDVLHWREGVDFKYRDSPRPTIVLEDSGARIRSLSAELAERIRSTQIQSLHAEEPQTWHNGEQVWRTLAGRMRHSLRSAKAYPDMPIAAWLTYNPGGIPGAPVGSWLYNLVEEKWKAQPVERCDACRARDPEATGYPSWRFSLRENYLLPGVEQYIRNIEANLPENLWPVEIDGQYPTSGGDVYRRFDQRIHSTVPQGFPPMGLRPEPLLWALDFNVGYQCSTIAQTWVQQPKVEYREGRQVFEATMPVPGWQRRTFYFIDEIALVNSGAEDVVQHFLTMNGGIYGQHAKTYGLSLYGDCTGGSRSSMVSSQSAIRSNWEAIVDGLRRAGIRVTIRIQRANPNEMERVNAMNAQFRTGAGYGVLVDLLKCPVLVNDWVNVKLKPGTNEIEKKTKPEAAARLTHMSDAAGYMVWVERKLEKDGPRSVEWSLVR